MTRVCIAHLYARRWGGPSDKIIQDYDPVAKEAATRQQEVLSEEAEVVLVQAKERCPLLVPMHKRRLSGTKPTMMGSGRILVSGKSATTNCRGKEYSSASGPSETITSHPRCYSTFICLLTYLLYNYYNDDCRSIHLQNPNAQANTDAHHWFPEEEACRLSLVVPRSSGEDRTRKYQNDDTQAEAVARCESRAHGPQAGLYQQPVGSSVLFLKSQ